MADGAAIDELTGWKPETAVTECAPCCRGCTCATLVSWQVDEVTTEALLSVCLSSTGVSVGSGQKSFTLSILCSSVACSSLSIPPFFSSFLTAPSTRQIFGVGRAMGEGTAGLGWPGSGGGGGM